GRNGSGMVYNSNQQHLAGGNLDRPRPVLRSGKCEGLKSDNPANIRVEYADEPDIEQDQIPNLEWPGSRLDSRSHNSHLRCGLRMNGLRETNRKRNWVDKVEDRKSTRLNSSHVAI